MAVSTYVLLQRRKQLRLLAVSAYVCLQRLFGVCGRVIWGCKHVCALTSMKVAGIVGCKRTYALTASIRRVRMGDLGLYARMCSYSEESS